MRILSTSLQDDTDKTPTYRSGKRLVDTRLQEKEGDVWVRSAGVSKAFLSVSYTYLQGLQPGR